MGNPDAVGLVSRSKAKNENGAEPRLSDHAHPVLENQGQSPWYAGPPAMSCSPRHDDMPILNGIVQSVENEDYVSAGSDGESETVSYFPPPFPQLPTQSSDGEDVEGECPPSVRVKTPPSSPVQRRSVM